MSKIETNKAVATLLREPVRIDVSPPPLIVTRDGVPCPDQKAALEEFKRACAVRVEQVEHEDRRKMIEGTASQAPRRSADDIVVEFIQNFTKIPLDEAAHRELVRIIEAERV